MAWLDDLWGVVRTIPISASVGLPGTRATPMRLADIEDALPSTQRRKTGQAAGQLEQFGLVPPGTRQQAETGALDMPGLERLQAVYQAAPLRMTQPGTLQTLYPTRRTPPPATIPSISGYAVSDAPAMLATEAGAPVTPPPDRNAYVRQLVGMLPTAALPQVVQAEYQRERPPVAKPLSAADLARLQLDQARLRQQGAYQQGQLGLQQARLTQQQRYQDAQLQLGKDRLAQGKAPTLNLAQRGLFTRMFPGHPINPDLLPDADQRRFYDRVAAQDEVGKIADLERKDRVAAAKEERKAAGLVSGAQRAYQQLNDMVGTIFTMSSLPADAKWWQKATWLPAAYRERARLYAEQQLQPAQSAVRLYHEAAGAHIITITRALAATGRLSNQELDMVKGLLPGYGAGVFGTPDTKETAAEKMRLLGELLARPPNTYPKFGVTETFQATELPEGAVRAQVSDPDQQLQQDLEALEAAYPTP